MEITVSYKDKNGRIVLIKEQGNTVDVIENISKVLKAFPKR